MTLPKHSASQSGIECFLSNPPAAPGEAAETADTLANPALGTSVWSRALNWCASQLPAPLPPDVSPSIAFTQNPGPDEQYTAITLDRDQAKAIETAAAATEKDEVNEILGVRTVEIMFSELCEELDSATVGFLTEEVAKENPTLATAIATISAASKRPRER